MLIPIPISRRLLRRYATTSPCTQTRPAKNPDGGGGRLHRLAAGGSDHANSAGRMQGQAGGKQFCQQAASRASRGQDRRQERTEAKAVASCR